MTAPAILITLLTAPALAGALLVSSTKITKGLPRGWQPLTFKKISQHTTYSWDDKERAVHASARASASGLIYRLSGDASQTPILTWRWKVSHVLNEGDARRKKGDDYPARIYVTFKYDPKLASRGMRFKYGLAKRLHGEYPPHAGINYIWGNKLPKGTSIDNAYTDRVKMIAVRSGPKETGQWQAEKRDILADYKKLFGGPIPELAGIAIMSDTDNTGESVEAWFADIRLHGKEKTE
jgi:hypothetical protein